MSADLQISSRLIIPGRWLSWVAVRASGPGGQNVNKVASKVILTFDYRKCPLIKPGVAKRLAAAHASKHDKEGRLTVVSQLSRNQSDNLSDARRKLTLFIQQALVIPKRRRATKPTRGSQRRRLESKRKQGDKKQARKKDWS